MPPGATRPPFPRLWVIATGRPDGVLKGYGLKRLPAWPLGFHGGQPADARGVVVLRELPCTRQALLLRLLGAGSVLRTSLEELGRLPAAAWERKVAVDPLVAARFEIPHDTEDVDERDLLMSTERLYEEWKQKFVQSGREQGVKQTLLTVCGARFGALPHEMAAVLGATHDPATLERWSRLVATRSPEEIAATMRSEGTATRAAPTAA